MMFDNFTFEKLFQYELYQESFKRTSICAPGFISLEVENGFLGFLFEREEECEGFQGILKKFGAFGHNLFQGRSPGNESLKNVDKAKTYINNIKENFITDEMKKYDENFIEDGIEIFRSRNMEILGPIYYDEQEGKFQFEELSEELKMIFKENGITKKLLDDPELGYSIIKKIILIVSGNEALKEKVFGAQEIHWDRPDAEKKIPVKKNTAVEDEYNPTKTKVQKTTPKPTQKPVQQKPKPVPKTNPVKPVTTNPTPVRPATKQAPQKPVSKPAPTQNQKTSKPVNNPPKTSGPAVPPPPPPPPFIPVAKAPAKPSVAKPTQEKKVEPKKEPAKPQLSMEEQLKQAQSALKKVEKPKVEEKLVTTNEKTFLQAALSNAIANRRRNLMENEDENSSDEEDW